MKIINLSKNSILAEEVFLADSFLARLKGLLGFEFLGKNQAMILRPSNSIHTFFMRFSIDVLFVDKNYKVLKALHNLKPNRISHIYWNSNRVIELPAGSLNLTNTQAQDQLQLL